MPIVRTIQSLALASVLLAVSGALAREKASGESTEDEPREAKAGSIAASLEFLLGFGNTFEANPDKGSTQEFDGKTTFGIVPGFDKMLGRNFGIGGEYMFVWGGPDEKGSPDERSLIMSPHLRARMTFPVYANFTFDALLGIGPTIWAANDSAAKGDATGDTRFGWSLRFNFGAGYKLNDSVAAFTALGYYTSTTYGDDVALNLNTVPLSVGLRSSF